MLAWPLGIGVAGQRGPWLKMDLRGGGARMAWASELGALPVDFPATMQHDASPDRTAQRSLPAVLSGHAWSGVVPFATFVAMACKGSGVQVPSAPLPRNRRSSSLRFFFPRRRSGSALRRSSTSGSKRAAAVGIAEDGKRRHTPTKAPHVPKAVIQCLRFAAQPSVQGPVCIWSSCDGHDPVGPRRSEGHA
jgi:hypothetical protein